MGSKKFKWNRWPKFRNQWRHTIPYKSPVRMWTSEVVLHSYKEVDGEEVPIYVVRGSDINNQKPQKS